MSSIWVRMVLRRSRRATWTIVGIALCTMYLTGTISLVEGLHKTTSDIADRFQQGAILAYRGDALSTSRIPENVLEFLKGPVAAISITEANIHVRGSSALVRSYVASISDPDGIINFSKADAGGYMGVNLANRFRDLGAPLNQESRLLLQEGISSTEVQVSAVFGGGTLVSSDWLLVEKPTLLALDQSLNGNISVIVLPEGSKADMELLRAMGFEIQTSMTVVRFFELGIYQIEGCLWAVLLVTSVIVTMLTYSALSIEIGYRQDDIRLLKQIGTPGSMVTGMFIARGGYLSIIGSAIGAAAGFMVANVLVSFTTVIGVTSMILPQASLTSLLFPVIIVLLAGILGAAIPSGIAGRRILKEVPS
ncbi:MAG: ABC transporter permease [Euryarchaeota archaeon]|nr:ABC transporter permease [Euryarchaeota archaeon]